MTDTTLPTQRTGALETAQVDYILLDGSGSMMDKWWDTLDSVDAYVAECKTQRVASRLILSVFSSHNIDAVARDENLQSWQPMRENPAGSTWGTTPLYDAIFIAGQRLKDLDPAKAHILIVTDGEENASKTSLVQAKAVLDWMRWKGWQVTFIGANFSNSAQAKALGADKQSAIGVQQKFLSDAARSLAKKRANYGLSGAPMHWSEGEQQQFGGYLSNPNGNGTH